MLVLAIVVPTSQLNILNCISLVWIWFLEFLYTFVEFLRAVLSSSTSQLLWARVSTQVSKSGAQVPVWALVVRTPQPNILTYITLGCTRILEFLDVYRTSASNFQSRRAMVMLASSPSITSGVAVRFESSTFETCRGRNVLRKSQKNAGHVGMVRFNGMDGYMNGRSHCETVRGVVRAGLLEGKSGGVREEDAVKDDYLVSMLPSGSAVAVNVTNLGNNTRKVEAKIGIHAPLEAVWGVLTDYDRLVDHIPGLAESQVLERRPHGARLMQVTFLIVQLFASVSRKPTSFHTIPHLNDQEINWIWG